MIAIGPAGFGQAPRPPRRVSKLPARGDRVRPYTCRVRLTLERFLQRFAPVTP